MEKNSFTHQLLLEQQQLAQQHLLVDNNTSWGTIILAGTQ